MPDVEEYAEDALLEWDTIMDFMRAHTSNVSDRKWKFRKVVEANKSMFDRFCPFKIGDRVQLKKDVDVSNSPGWSGCGHFMKKGVRGIVKSRGYSDGLFTFYIAFDNETFITWDGEEKPVSEHNKHLFLFTEKKLKRVKEGDK